MTGLLTLLAWLIGLAHGLMGAFARAGAGPALAIPLALGLSLTHEGGMKCLF